MAVVIFEQHACVVSRAWCPAKIKCCVSVSKTAQLRRSLQLFIEVPLQSIWLKRKKYVAVQHVQHMWQDQHTPETPMPEVPLVRVLETFDLSATNVEHFLDPRADLKVLVSASVSSTRQEHR